MKNKQSISTFLGIAAAVVLATNSHAADINVPGDQPTIQAGINAANPGDVVIVAPGTYKEAIDFLGKAITVRSSGGPDVTTFDGTGFNTKRGLRNKLVEKQTISQVVAGRARSDIRIAVLVIHPAAPICCVLAKHAL